MSEYTAFKHDPDLIGKFSIQFNNKVHELDEVWFDSLRFEKDSVLYYLEGEMVKAVTDSDLIKKIQDFYGLR